MERQNVIPWDSCEPAGRSQSARAPVDSTAGAAPATGRSGQVTHGRFVLAALATSLVNLALHAAMYALFLGDFFRAHPAGSEEFVRQLQRPSDQLVVRAMAVTALTMGLFITVVMRWSGATTVAAGLRPGSALGLLFWLSVNSGLYASSHHFSFASAAVDALTSALCMTVAALCAVLFLHGPGPGARRALEPSRA